MTQNLLQASSLNDLFNQQLAQSTAQTQAVWTLTTTKPIKHAYFFDVVFSFGADQVNDNSFRDTRRAMGLGMLKRFGPVNVRNGARAFEERDNNGLWHWCFVARMYGEKGQLAKNMDVLAGHNPCLVVAQKLGVKAEDLRVAVGLFDTDRAWFKEQVMLFLAENGTAEEPALAKEQELVAA